MLDQVFDSGMNMSVVSVTDQRLILGYLVQFLMIKNIISLKNYAEIKGWILLYISYISKITNKQVKK